MVHYLKTSFYIITAKLIKKAYLIKLHIPKTHLNTAEY
uniref:Uncharacterized protein n=1 Tax=Anguilla anguilla TaxID=7936 RepID=A0A0E9XHV8_ANGAN